MRFARRTSWSRAENALSRATNRARAQQPLLDLTVSNPTMAGLEYEGGPILSALSRPEALRYEPHPLGALAARQAICAYYQRRGVEVSPEHLVLTASTSEAYGFLLRLLTDPGDAVLVPAPSYPLFDFLLDLADVRAVPYRLAHDGAWHLDRASLSGAEAPHVRAALVVSPNNPTGSVLDPGDRQALLDAIGDRPVISDEVFADYARHGHARASWLGTSTGPVFSLNGLSKIAGLPQLKLGWIVVSGPEKARAEALARLELIADTYLSVATPVQVALPELLDLAEGWQVRLRARLAANRQRLEDLLAGSPVSLQRSDGGWYALLELPRIHTDEEWAIRLVSQHGVQAQPGYFFEVLDGAVLVVSLLTHPEILEEGIHRLLFCVQAG